MKKRISYVTWTILLIVGFFFGASKKLCASNNEFIIDNSVLTHDKETIGYDTKITRGEDLLTGYSKCV
ncbi:hypothetical protein [[Clostridium] scindens]|nr:hypothetical protein [[Clostridium] scindens]MCB6288552.1 hypothetical protein [[Clostridium] scindens]MCB6422844.1 hypothetical protein [[Clostridium] scindens]MCB7194877.1 hypothetical protein [[Clostridium] scindens]MCB7288067.1 hypothetical protein [[Clostridium] scindens]MCG4931078.1 hypothetical protein [[Clostridium] scindens]